MWHACVLASVLCLVHSVGVAGQETQAGAPPPGSRVRVDADSGRLAAMRRLPWEGILRPTVTGRTGTFVGLRGDSLIWRPDDIDSALVLPLHVVQRLFVSRGPGSRMRGGAVGLAAGAAAGVAWALVMDGALGENLTVDYRRAVLLFSGVGAATGFIQGGQERWDRVFLPIGSAGQMGANPRRD